MDFLDPNIEDYVIRHTQAEDPVLAELNRETHAKVLIPRMLAGHLQGVVLQMFSTMIRPMQVLEVGTYTGYSAICWAKGLQEGGKVHTIDINEELEDMVRSYLEKAEVTDKVNFYIGNALEIIPAIDVEFDIVYLDADKENYANYYDMVFDQVKKGGYIIADNVLWSGKVLASEDQQDEETRALVAYSKKVHEDPRVENILLPIRDGLMVARKV